MGGGGGLFIGPNDGFMNLTFFEFDTSSFHFLKVIFRAVMLPSTCAAAASERRTLHLLSPLQGNPLLLSKFVRSAPLKPHYVSQHLHGGACLI